MSVAGCLGWKGLSDSAFPTSGNQRGTGHLTPNRDTDGHPRVAGSSGFPVTLSGSAVAAHGAGLYVWGLLRLWGPSATMAAGTGQAAVLSSHPEKTHPDFWSSPAMGGPAWAAGERSQRGTHPQFGPLASSGAFTSLRVGAMPYFFPTVPSPGGRNPQVSTESLPAHCDHGRRRRPVEEVTEGRHEKHFVDIL